MNKKIKYVIITLMIIIIAIAVIILIKYNQSKEISAPVDENKNTTEENILVIGMDEESQNNQDNEPEQDSKPETKPKKDASTLTQNIYNMNATIGTLYIPKTKLRTEVYSNPDANKMEKMPAFLYTSGGINESGISLIVGHNRRNGKMFSNNKKLSEGDVFYFTDYQGVEKQYTIYSKFITTSDDTSFLNNEVEKPVIALSCCTDASDDNRIIILGRAD